MLVSVSYIALFGLTERYDGISTEGCLEQVNQLPWFKMGNTYCSHN